MRAGWMVVLLLARAAAADGVEKATLAGIEAFGARWWKARPKTCFQEWDPNTRADLLREAEGFGKLPEGALGAARDALWKPLKKNGPKAKGSGKATIDTPYGEAWFYVKAAGRNKGLILGLHGGGEGAGSADEPAGTWQARSCMGMYPQGIRLVHDTWNTVHGEKFALTLIEIAKAQHDIDPDRVYAMGFSMGGSGSWHMAGRHPDLLAGASPCAGVVMAQPKSQVPTKEEVEAIQHGIVPNVRNLAMYYYNGTADRNCMPGTYLYVWDLLGELRRGDPGGYGNLHYTCHEGLAHAFPPGEPRRGIEWIERQRRVAFPEKVVWETALEPYPLPDAQDKTGRCVKRWFYWLHHERPADKMSIVATRKGNEFDISCLSSELEGLSILLNPSMIDVAREVVVRHDGTEVYRGKPEPEFVTLLESLDARLDRTLVFDRRVRLAPDGAR
ncbi:MAG: hypothetical protein ACREID_05800 [Planctomycetota bacterium]